MLWVCPGLRRQSSASCARTKVLITPGRQATFSDCFALDFAQEQFNRFLPHVLRAFGFPIRVCSLIGTVFSKTIFAVLDGG